MKKINILLLILSLAPMIASAEDNDCGLELGAEVSHKINKKWSVSADASMRSRNDFRTMDRWDIGIDASYKITKGIKLSAGYTLLDDNNQEKITTDGSGSITKWRPSYWGIRHRFNISLTGSLNYGRCTFSLRERWQYTYRPEVHTERYDFSEEQWEDKLMRSTNKHVLRSRLQIEYDIPKCKVDPYISTEFYNSLRLQKTRFIAGAEWKVNKKNIIEAFYRYQTVNNDDDNEKNTHIIGVSYKYKF